MRGKMYEFISWNECMNLFWGGLACSKVVLHLCSREGQVWSSSNGDEVAERAWRDTEEVGPRPLKSYRRPGPLRSDQT